jgi:hypothetical protein
MRWGVTLLTMVLAILFVLIAGCSNVSLGSAQVGNFGMSVNAQQAQNWFINQYGNPATYSGPPRFLEPMVSSGIVNGMPVDNVQEYSQNSPSVYFWVFYEGFKPGDSVTATWTFQGKQYATLTQQVGGNYGIINATFTEPTSGWVLGTHTITVTGDGVQNSTTFEIINGNTVTAPLPFETTSSGQISPTPSTSSGPTVTGVSPNSGPISGGTSVTITGSGFTGATAVKFSDYTATNVKVNSDTSITVTSPPSTEGSLYGIVDVDVITPIGTSSNSQADWFTYMASGTTTAPPTVTAVITIHETVQHIVFQHV